MTRRLLLLLLLALAPLAIILAVRESEPFADNNATIVTFADGFQGHLETVQEAAAALVDLGERRERNLLVVGQRQSAMNSALGATDAWLDQYPAHQADAAVAAYRSGASEIREAMADAQSAFLRFDWNAIAAANDTLKQGAADVALAEELLMATAGA